MTRENVQDQPKTESRRKALLLSAWSLTAVALPLREAVAQASAQGGDWLAMIRQHHDLIARSFEELLKKDDAAYERLALQVRTVDHLLNAHSLAEEAVIYPAIARAGLRAQAEKLYGVEADIKIIKSQLTLLVGNRQGGTEWRKIAGNLKDAVLRHARQDEEQQLFPQLQQQLGPDGNRMLADLYARQFSAVLPVRP